MLLLLHDPLSSSRQADTERAVRRTRHEKHETALPVARHLLGRQADRFRAVRPRRRAAHA
jgi:hypothetical protein